MKIHAEISQITRKVMDDFVEKLGRNAGPQKQP
jgi:hypothetical protein